MQDKILECHQCGKQFLFSVKEQIKYRNKDFDDPKRCNDCRNNSKRIEFNYFKKNNLIDKSIDEDENGTKKRVRKPRKFNHKFYGDGHNQFT